jgi:KaiC/GvpD/RAD55 family RecA-like ATPase
MLTRTGVTSILTSEIQEGTNKFGRYEVEEYVVDGVIVLHYSGVGGGGTNRTIHIRKMRATKHSEDLHPMSITKNGIKVHELEEVYEEG